MSRTPAQLPEPSRTRGQIPALELLSFRFPPSSRHSGPEAWGSCGSCCLVATFGGFRVTALVYYVRRLGSLGTAFLRRMTLHRYTYSHPELRKRPWPLRGSRGMAMARASLVRSSLAWLHVLQQMYRMMASAGVIIPAPLGGTPGRQAHVCLLSPSGQRAEHDVARSWTERSRPRATDKAIRSTSVLVLTSRDVWAPTRELAL